MLFYQSFKLLYSILKVLSVCYLVAVDLTRIVDRGSHDRLVSPTEVSTTLCGGPARISSDLCVSNNRFVSLGLLSHARCNTIVASLCK